MHIVCIHIVVIFKQLFVKCDFLCYLITHPYTHNNNMNNGGKYTGYMNNDETINIQKKEKKNRK